MKKRVLAWLGWVMVFYIASFLVVGLIGWKDLKTKPISFQHGIEAGDAFAEDYVVPYRIPVLIFSVILSSLGTITGVLPGTKKAKSNLNE